MFLFLWLSGLVTTLCVFFYFWGTVSEKPQWKSVMSTRNWIECSESDKVRTEVRVTKPCVQYWSNLVFFIFHLSHSVFTWSLFLVQPWSCCKVVSLILFSWVPHLSLRCCLWLRHPCRVLCSFETISITGALEIVVTVCLLNCLNPISTYYIFGYRWMSVFQCHRFLFLNKNYKVSHKICFKSVKLTHSHLDLTEIQTSISQYLV